MMKNNKATVLFATMFIFAMFTGIDRGFCQNLASDDLDMKTAANHVDNDPNKPLCVADSIAIVQKAQAQTEQLEKHLNLTEVQIQAVQKINFDYMRQLFRLNSSTLTEPEHEEKLKSIGKNRSDALKAILSEEQQSKLNTNAN